MDAHDFYHTNECSADVYEAMEQYANYVRNETLKEIHSQAKDAPITENWIGFNAYKTVKK
jgi:hypothetical protein